MEKVWIIFIALVVFTLMALLFHRVMRGYVREEFGKKWLSLWGNKVYFWQSLIFMSMAGTVLVMYLMKWAQVISF